MQIFCGSGGRRPPERKKGGCERQRGDLDGLRQQYPEVARVVGEPPALHADD
ncbi:hypothetical protein [Halocatena salina]|uniref:Uncharacterized protein n=1 Tax=Halocatena salina TaxID=2934340 RepID=A0A8T9ZZX8_9EURY|nr:hypothetical protein [Halocatena salina]UPM41688.1 hypothetical protein MW046_06725 [Halocatena salina]